MAEAPRWQAVLVDDEPLARRELRRLLAAHPEVAVVAEADSVAGAAERVRLTGADLVFLDVQLADGESGLDLVERLEPGVRVVFVTAHDRYAVRAFEAHALDYLLKPVAPERLARAVARLGPGEAPRGDGADAARAGGRREAPPAPADAPLGVADRLFLRIDARMGFLCVAHIAAVLADRDASDLLLADGRRVRVQKPLAEWAARLPASHFLQIHRSALVNLDHVARVEEWSHRSFHVWLRGRAEPLVMSRRFAARVRERLG
jgi:two-component system LytT family response regulator